MVVKKYLKELKEFNKFLELTLKQRGEEGLKTYEYKFYEYKGRKIVGVHIRKGFSVKTEYRFRENKADDKSVSFLKIEKSPTFPGCGIGDKTCFSKMIQKHFARNFNADLRETLGLSSGKKRVFIAFSINNKGNVVDIKSRGPHPKIEKEVLRVMQLLPKMKPGEQDGKKVKVSYTIPFTIFVPEKRKNKY